MTCRMVFIAGTPCFFHNIRMAKVRNVSQMDAQLSSESEISVLIFRYFAKTDLYRYGLEGVKISSEAFSLFA